MAALKDKATLKGKKPFRDHRTDDSRTCDRPALKPPLHAIVGTASAPVAVDDADPRLFVNTELWQGVGGVPVKLAVDHDEGIPPVKTR
jgi:hypothetical protein